MTNEWAATFHATFLEEDNEFDCAFENVQYIDRDPYTGPYEVTPTVEDQILETNKKSMTRNVTVRGIGEISYPSLTDKPAIEGNVLIGDKTFKQLGLGEITPQEIDDIFDELIYGG